MRELTLLKDLSEITRRQVFVWEKRIEAQWCQNTILKV